jgi:hypothetical protein
MDMWFSQPKLMTSRLQTREVTIQNKDDRNFCWFHHFEPNQTGNMHRLA